MKHTDFLKQLDHTKVTAAIGAAEKLTSGEIRVMVSRQAATDPIARAQKEFTRLGMTKTQARNGVLIFVAPVSQTFAIIGDEGIHRECGPAFWDELAAAMREHFKAADYTAGLVSGIARAGEFLGGHFPRQADDKNELPDDVITD